MQVSLFAMKNTKFWLFLATGLVLLATAGILFPVSMIHVHAANAATITVNGSPMGISTQYIGANSGPGFDGTSGSYNSTRFRDVGFTSMRIWDKTTEFEPTETSSTYGSPSVSDVKAAGTAVSNNGQIPWSTWDNNFQPYRAFFDQLKSDNIRVMISLNNNNHGGGQPDDSWIKGWTVSQPLPTDADINEWWRHVFSEVYLLNVRNNYHIDDWEIGNEPDRGDQGEPGDTPSYIQFVQYTSDAIKYAYSTFLPGRTPNIYASALSYPQVAANGLSGAFQDQVFSAVGNDFNAVSYHYYHTGNEFSNGIHIAHNQANNAGHGNYPVWITEWGSYDDGTYKMGNPNCNSDSACAVEQIDNMIRGSLPGNDHLDGSEYYLWSNSSYGDSILDSNANPRTVYYALRLGIRALQGGKTTYQSSTGTSDLNSITTVNSDGTINLLTVNTSGTDYSVNEDLSALNNGSGSTTIYQYDANHADTASNGPALSNGQVAFSIPAHGAVLIQVGAGTSSGSGNALNRSGWVASASAADTAEWASQAIDGDLNTRWSTGHSMQNGDWFQVDMGSAQSFNRIVLDATNSPDDYPRGYQVVVSNDGNTWSSPVATGSGTGAITSITFDPQNARYIRVVQTQNTGWWWSIDEFNVYPSSSALNRSGWVASASVANTAEWAPRAIDGDLTTRWSTGRSMQNGDWFQVNLGSVQSFSRLVLDVTNSNNDYPRGYQVLVSNDGNTWSNPVATGSGSGAITSISFSSQNAQYIRVVQTQNTGWWWSIDEFNVYP